MCQLRFECARCAQQEELEAVFIQLDKAKGRATSSLGKGELGDALKAFFRVGQPGGKSEERHDELMQVCFSHSRVHFYLFRQQTFQLHACMH